MNAEHIPLPCPVCENGHLTQQSVFDAVEYKGQKGNIPHYFSHCDVCGSEIADAAQTLENKREWVKFRKQIDGVPLGHEIAKMRQRHGLTQVLAGQLFGGGPVAFSKYEHDDFFPDESMTNLLYLAMHYPENIYHLATRKNIPLTRPETVGREMLRVSLKMEQPKVSFDFGSVEIKYHSLYGSSKKSTAIIDKSCTTIENGMKNGEQTWSLQ